MEGGDNGETRLLIGSYANMAAPWVKPCGPDGSARPSQGVALGSLWCPSARTLPGLVPHPSGAPGLQPVPPRSLPGAARPLYPKNHPQPRMGVLVSPLSWGVPGRIGGDPPVMAEPTAASSFPRRCRRAGRGGMSLCPHTGLCWSSWGFWGIPAHFGGPFPLAPSTSRG